MNIVTDPYIIRYEIRNYFSTAGQHLDAILPHTDASPLQYRSVNFPSMSLSLTTSSEIKDIMIDIKNSSPGYDGIHTKVIKLWSSVLAPVLFTLINLSFRCGIFSDLMKASTIVKIHKADKLQPSQYRPISILSKIGKIIEKAIYSRFLSFLNTNRILINNQFGFRKNFSPHTATTRLVDEILKANEEVYFTLAVFLDLTKAFDTINH